jgi:hypothetical protein
MKKVFLIPVLVFILFAVGCAGNSTQTEATTTETAAVEEEHHHGQLAEVQLDNGEKWEANAETTEGIDNMLLAVNNTADSEAPDYLALKDNLEKEFMIILEKCTMTGESHDQLHNYLLPLKAKYDQLEASSTKHDIEELSDYLNSYRNYFK